MLVAFTDQVSNLEIISKCETLFSSELQHVLHSPAPSLLLGIRRLFLDQRFESTRDNLLCGAKAPGAELLLDQTLTVGIESNGHRTPVYPQECCYGFGATGAAGFPNFADSIGTFPCTALSSVVDCPLVHVTVQ